MWNGRKFRTRYEANCQMMHLHQLNCNYEHLEELTCEPWTVDQLAGTRCIHRKWHIQSQLLFKGSSLKTPKLRENSEELFRSSRRALLKISQSTNGCTARAEQHAAAMPLFFLQQFWPINKQIWAQFCKILEKWHSKVLFCVKVTVNQKKDSSVKEQLLRAQGIVFYACTHVCINNISSSVFYKCSFKIFVLRELTDSSLLAHILPLLSRCLSPAVRCVLNAVFMLA